MKTALDLPNLSQERKKNSRLSDSNNNTMLIRINLGKTAMEQTEVTGTWAGTINLTELLVIFLGMRAVLR